ncbi:VIC family transporter: potassium ion channel, partial [Ostreococcus lucimarinus CCE9901]
HDVDGWSTFVDAVYFIAITVTTVGYGDISPQTDAGKIFMLFFIIVGIALATVVISKITDLIVDAKERSEVKAQEELDRS